MIWQYFTNSELSCHCGNCDLGPSAMNPEFMATVVAMREIARFPFNVTSSIRCPEHNARESSTGLIGPHTTGHALDIAVSRGRAHQFVKLALEYGMTGIGLRQKGSGRFIHIDDLKNEETKGPRPTIWTY